MKFNKSKIIDVSQGTPLFTPNFTKFPSVEILWKSTVSTWFRAIHPKLCGNCTFPQNFHTRKLGEITVFYAVLITPNFTTNYESVRNYFINRFCQKVTSNEVICLPPPLSLKCHITFSSKYNTSLSNIIPFPHCHYL